MWKQASLVGLFACILACGTESGSPQSLNDGSSPETSTPPTTEPTEPTTTPSNPNEAIEFEVYDLAPTEGRTAGGELVVMEGEGFVDNMEVYFGSRAAASVNILSPHVIHLYTPSHSNGVVDVKVRAPDGTSRVLENGFLFRDRVALHAIEPTEGPAEGGTPVTATGEGFTEDTKILIGGRLLVGLTVVDSTTVLGIAPPGSTGLTDVLASTALGQAQLDKGFRYTSPPTISNLTPTSGPTDGETQLMLEGTGLVETAIVTVGQYPAAVMKAKGTKMKVLVTGGDEGPADVQVTTESGSVVLPGAFTFVASNPPKTLQILNLYPPTGTNAGGDFVEITAYGLTNSDDMQVWFGDSLAEVIVSDTLVHRLVVSTPAGSGTVDVQISNSSGSDTLSQGFTYTALPAPEMVSPDSGPEAGGTSITVTGSNLSSVVAAYVGALPGTITSVSDTTIELLTPPGSPGMVDVRLYTADSEAVLPAAYHYVGSEELALYAITPDYGAIAGNTLLTLYGTGFEPHTEVRFAKQKLELVEVISSTEIQARSPKADEPVTVDVTVAEGELERTILDGYSYFDPASPYGGAWGPPIDGTVNITVLDLTSTDPIPAAFVMLGNDPSTPFQGMTDDRGQITFSSPEIVGAQLVTASKPEYTAYSVAQYDTENVTVHLIPMTPSSGGGGGGPEILPLGHLEGTVTGLGKYVQVPPQTCTYMAENKWVSEAGSTACEPCKADSDCGENARCLDVAGSSNTPGVAPALFCVPDCLSNDDCSTHYLCTTAADSEPGCLPHPGLKTAYCQTTHHEIWEAPPEPHTPSNTGGKAWIESDGSYWMKTRLGELAVLCIGGVSRDPEAPETSFEPLMLGVVRHVQPIPGEPIMGIDVELNIPLDKTIPIVLDQAPLTYVNPATESSSPTEANLRVLLDFASDGYWNVADMNGVGQARFVLDKQPRSVGAGDLENVTYGFLATVEGAGNQMASSNTQSYNVSVLEVDRLFEYSDGAWSVIDAGIPRDIHSLWGLHTGNVWAAGDNGLLAHNANGSWFPQYSPTVADLHGIWASSDTHAVAVGDLGTIITHNGSQWSIEEAPTIAPLYAVWGTAPDHVYAVGDGIVLHRDANEWTAVDGAPSVPLRSAWGPSPGELWSVGDDGKLWMLANGTWTATPLTEGFRLRSIHGTDPNNVWIVGDLGTVLRRGSDGQWTQLDVPTTEHLNAVHAVNELEAFVVGDRGTLLHWDGYGWTLEAAPKYGGNLTAVWGDSSPGSPVLAAGTQVVRLGPMLAIPRIESPKNPQIGQQLPFDYHLKWSALSGALPTFNFVEMLGGPGVNFPVWWTVVEAETMDVLLPNLPEVKGFSPFLPGYTMLMVHRVLKPGASVDNFDFWDTYYKGTWMSWATAGVPFYP